MQRNGDETVVIRRVQRREQGPQAFGQKRREAVDPAVFELTDEPGDRVLVKHREPLPGDAVPGPFVGLEPMDARLQTGPAARAEPFLFHAGGVAAAQADGPGGEEETGDALVKTPHHRIMSFASRRRRLSALYRLMI